jgi:hypothetical protein
LVVGVAAGVDAVPLVCAVKGVDVTGGVGQHGLFKLVVT